MRNNIVFIALLLMSITGHTQGGKVITIANFSAGQFEGWETKSFNGETQYTLTRLGDQPVLKAESHGSASGLFKEQRIDLSKTPYLNWRWRIENRLGKLDEQSKAGDDYAARIYVVVSGGLAFWKTRALNYVWSGNLAKGKTWPNAFAGKNAMMIVMRTPDDATQQWFNEKRNIQQDLEKIYGEPIRYIDAVALMTDTDNANGTATAYYGDIFFSAN